MTVWLMHKDLKVAVVTFNDNSLKFKHPYEVLNKEHLPIGVKSSKKFIESLNAWLKSRIIPANREHLDSDLVTYQQIYQLFNQSYGASLSDCYWICPIHLNLTWNKINFFTNSFSSRELIKIDSDLVSPNVSLNGWLRKKWKIVNNDRILFKSSSQACGVESINEWIAFNVAKFLELPVVDYQVLPDNSRICFCKAFTSENLEYVPVYQMHLAKAKQNSQSRYQWILEMLESYNTADAKQYLDNMIVFDFLIGNQDRHLGNFGILRNPDSLETVCMAPLFDNGSSFGFDQDLDRAAIYKEYQAATFKNTLKEQLELVENCHIDLGKLQQVPDFVMNLLINALFVPLLNRIYYYNFILYRVEYLVSYFEKRIVEPSERTTLFI